MCGECNFRKETIHRILLHYRETINRGNYGPDKLTLEQINIKIEAKELELESLTSELLLDEYGEAQWAAGLAAGEESTYM